MLTVFLTVFSGAFMCREGKERVVWQKGRDFRPSLSFEVACLMCATVAFQACVCVRVILQRVRERAR